MEISTVWTRESYIAKVATDSPPAFRKEFLTDVAELPEEYSSFHDDFVRIWGIMVITDVAMGSMQAFTFKQTVKQANEFRKKNISFFSGAMAAMRALFSVSLSAEEKTASDAFSSNSVSEYSAYGIGSDQPVQWEAITPQNVCTPGCSSVMSWMSRANVWRQRSILGFAHSCMSCLCCIGDVTGDRLGKCSCALVAAFKAFSVAAAVACYYFEGSKPETENPLQLQSHTTMDTQVSSWLDRSQPTIFVHATCM
jgi:hypothetical protein